MSRHLVYDTGALLAADRSEPRLWAAHRKSLTLGIAPLVPAGVLGQAWRDGSKQVMLARLLKGCDVIPFDRDMARRAGALLCSAGTSDVIDASVALLAVELAAVVLTSDEGDIRHLLAAHGRAGERATVVKV